MKVVQILGKLSLNDKNLYKIGEMLDTNIIIINSIGLGNFTKLKELCLPITLKHLIIKKINVLGKNDVFDLNSGDIIKAIKDNIKLPFGCKLSFYFRSCFDSGHFINDNIYTQDRPIKRMETLINTEILNVQKEDITYKNDLCENCDKD